MRRRLLLTWVSALLLCFATALVACGDDDDEGGGDGADAADIDTIRPGTLIVGSDIPYRPFAQGRPPDYEGFDIDLINDIAERLELRVEIKDTPFDTIFRDVARGKFDVAISGSTITDERERKADFSDPYFEAEQSILTKEDSGIKTVKDLAGKTVGVQKGTTGEAYAKENAKAGDLRTYPEIDDAFKALVAGQLDAVLFDLPGTQQAAADTEGLEVTVSIPTGEQLGIALAEDADALREAVNEALAEAKEDGTFARLYNRWFKKDPPQRILDATHTPS